jgi:hypothetical protein
MRRLAVLILAGVLARPAAADDLGDARRFADAGNYGPALVAYDRVVAAQPGNSDLAIERARVLGYADRHADAIAAYHEIVARFPQRRPDVAGYWAWQELWSGDAAAAVPLFREALQQRPGNPDLTAGLAESLLWSGREREAARVYGTLLPPANDALAPQAARAYYWAGFPEQALPLLADSALPAAQWLRDYRVSRERRHYLSGSVDASDDSDDLSILTATAAAGWRFGAGDTAELSVRSAWLDGPDTSQPSNPGYSVDGQDVLLAWSGRQGSVDSPAGVVWPLLAVGVRDYDGWSEFAWRARVRWMPDDGLSFTAYGGNGVVETVGAIRNEIGYTEGSLSGEGRLTQRWLLSGSLSRIAFDRGNDRSQGTLRLEYLLVPEWRMRTGIDAVYFSDSEPVGPGQPSLGYWNPDRYSEQRLYASVSNERGAWSFDGRASAGYFQERDGWGTDSGGAAFAIEAVAACDLSPSLRLKIYAGGSNSGYSFSGGGSGYHRTYAGVAITGWL